MCKYPIFMALVLLDRRGHLHLLPRLLWDGGALFLPGGHPPPQFHPQTEGKGTFSLQTGLSPACGAASTGKTAGCELERSKKTFRKVCHMSGAFPAGHIHSRRIQHPKPLSTSSRSGNHASPCKGNTQPDRRAHAPAVAADSLAKAFCWVFHLQPPAFLCSGTLLLPSAENPPVLSQKQRLPASESPRMSLLIPAWDFGVTKDTLSRCPTAPLVQGQHSGFCLHGAGRRCLTKPLWGISLGRNLTSMPGAGSAGRRSQSPPRNGSAPGKEQRSTIQAQFLAQKRPEPAHIRALS